MKGCGKNVEKKGKFSSEPGDIFQRKGSFSSFEFLCLYILEKQKDEKHELLLKIHINTRVLFSKESFMPIFYSILYERKV